eukprot:4509032-Lingulodinium_polyedra.AAC.1
MSQPRLEMSQPPLAMSRHVSGLSGVSQRSLGFPRFPLVSLGRASICSLGFPRFPSVRDMPNT